MRTWLTHRLQCKLGPQGPVTLMLGIAVVLLIALLWMIASMSSGNIVAMDAEVARVTLGYRTETLLRVFYGITLLADMRVVVAIAVVATVIFGMKRHTVFIAILWMALALTSLATWYGKLFFARLRPDATFAAIHESFYSLPSGHAMYAVSLYGACLYACMKSTVSHAVKRLSIVVTVTCVILVCASRVYLGVHFVSDVIVGALTGLIILLLSITIGESVTRLRSTSNDRQSPASRTLLMILLPSIAFYLATVALSPVPLLRSF